ncbi:nuclear transport factor 2 family protein [Pseudoduganella namucuonensis]|uniref:Ketosteroid isomerase homolog n=1 Tax=Pseudoduganella namucuonensis TaxID=1035707 RepID=A0A1I7LZJ7_9BURK|nr:nuclear transport factor 2 family protein [Pseudoduganella namucuonensis]SFV15076.1 Ketosteroid isomerase homolog [Pseudoduganella namucuonensis]
MTTAAQADTTLRTLAARLHRLEAERAVRNTLARYMALCDQPCDDRDFPRLGDLFTEDAAWEGVGERYARTFGRQVGRAAITAFLGGYLAPSTHFKRNLHFLTSDQVTVAGDGERVHGQWIMLQISTYEDGRSEAISARLQVEFSAAPDGRWLIARFRTERLDCVPWDVAGGAAA